MAASSNATCPYTGVARNVTPWLIAPNRPEALTVPAMTALPPLITVMKALAI